MSRRTRAAVSGCLLRALRVAEARARESGEAEVEILVRVARERIESRGRSGTTLSACDCVVRVAVADSGLHVEASVSGGKFRPVRSTPTVIMVLGLAEKYPTGIPRSEITAVQASRTRQWFRGELDVVDNPLHCRSGKYFPQWRLAPRNRSGQEDPDPPKEIPFADLGRDLDPDDIPADGEGAIKRAVRFQRRKGVQRPKEPPSRRVSAAKCLSGVSARRRLGGTCAPRAREDHNARDR